MPHLRLNQQPPCLAGASDSALRPQTAETSGPTLHGIQLEAELERARLETAAVELIREVQQKDWPPTLIENTSGQLLELKKRAVAEIMSELGDYDGSECVQNVGERLSQPRKPLLKLGHEGFSLGTG